MSTVSFQELDAITGELLPERTLLSTVTDFGGGSGGSGSGSAAAAAAGGGGTTIVNFGDDGGAIGLSACHSSQSFGTPGLLGSLGLGSNNPTVSQTCTPALVAN